MRGAKRRAGQWRAFLGGSLGERARLVVAGMCVATFLVGAAYAHYRGNALPFPDEQEYVAIADNFANEGTFSIDGQRPTAARPPAWPLLLGGLRFLGASVPLLRTANVVLFVTCLWVLYLLLERTHSRLAGLAGVTLALLYPVLFYTAETLFPQMLQALLLLLVVWLLFADGCASWRRRLAVGVSSGLLVLTVPILVVLIPPLVLLSPIRPGRSKAAVAAVVVLAMVVLVGAWQVRNVATFGRTPFVSTNGGINLLLGNSPRTTPNAGVNVDLTTYYREAEKLDEFEKDRYFRDQAIKWIRSNKHEAAWLYLRKVANHFNFRNELAVRSEGSLLRDLAVAVTYGGLLILVAARLALRRKLPLTVLDRACLVLYGLAALVTAVFFTRIRFRAPFDFLLLILAAPVAALPLARWGRSGTVSFPKARLRPPCGSRTAR